MSTNLDRKTKTTHVQNGRCFRFACGTSFIRCCARESWFFPMRAPTVQFVLRRRGMWSVERRRLVFFFLVITISSSSRGESRTLLTNFVECQQSLVCVDLITPEVECTPRYFYLLATSEFRSASDTRVSCFY